MRTHLQGIALLGLLVLALLGPDPAWPPPTLSEAFGDDGAVQADSGDVVDLVVGGATLDAPLDDDERARLQFHLVIWGYLDDIADVDGIIGPGTRAAMAEAASDWGLDEPTDREFLIHADEHPIDTPLSPELTLPLPGSSRSGGRIATLRAPLVRRNGSSSMMAR